MPDFELEGFESYLRRKELSFETKKLYLLFFDKLLQLLKGLGSDLTQDIADAFLDLYPHVIAKAMLKNYIEWKDIYGVKIVRRTGRRKKKIVETIPESEIDKIRIALYEKNIRWGILFDLSEGCALRRQEVINIKCSDIDSDALKKKYKMFIKIRKAKGSKERMVYVPEDIAERVLLYINDQGLEIGDYLFKSPAKQGEPISKYSWNRVFSNVAFEVTGKKYHPHQLRHSTSLNWYNKGVDIIRIKERLGHSDISTTNLYINPENKRELEMWSKEDE